jgi:hypothetical protein
MGLVAGLLLAAAPVALAGMAGAQPTADEEWRKTLRQQLVDQYGCKLEQFVFERETPIDGRNVREGRIRCLDGREIDYSQSSILLRFELRLCSPTVC